MHIGQLAEQSGVNLETIRYYERVGLIPAPPRTAAGYRQYQVQHLRQLVFLRRSRQLGFSIREIRDLFDLAGQPHRNCQDVRRLAATHLDAVSAKIRELQRLRRALQKLVYSCSGERRIADCGILEALGDPGPAGRRKLLRR